MPVAPTALRRTAAVLALLGATACQDVPPEATGGSQERLALPVPAPIAQARAVVPDALSLEVRVNGERVRSERGENGWTFELTTPPGVGASLQATWQETVDGRPLTLATWSGTIGPFDSDARLELDPARYDTAFDDDGDGVENLDERRVGTDARVAGDPAVTAGPPATDAPTAADPSAPIDTLPAPFVYVPSFDPAQTPPPTVDGIWRSTDGWSSDGGTFTDAAGALLGARRLLAGDGRAGAANPDGALVRQWVVKHDGEWLYLYVLYRIAAGQPPPLRDSGAALENDDALHLFFDVDGSRGREPAGRSGDGPDAGDDRHVVVPLVATGDDRSRVTVFAPDVRAPVVPSSLEARVCPCTARNAAAHDGEATDTGWEIRVRLDELGIRLGVPFGFELQIDQDVDGGTRDARWAWASAPPAERPAGLEDGSPSLAGTMQLVD